MSITDELREWMRIVLTDDDPAYAIADRIDSALADGYVKLPKDRDREYIHIGDVMEVINSKQRAEACYMQMGPSGTWAVGLTKNCHWYDTESLRHHATTVEDVLREFMDVMLGTPSKDAAARIAEYAAKLQLKEDE